MSAPLGVGIVGCGQISATYLRLMPRFAGIRAVALADIAPALAEARAAEFGVAAMPVAALMAAPEVDVVLNLTVPAAHAEVGLAALAAGKHVYSEKPLAMDVAEADALIAAARAAGRRLGAAPDTFLGAAAQQARALVDGGAIGRVLGGSAHVMGRGPAPWHPNPDFFYRAGGGPALDMGPYYISQLVNLLGPVARVTAMTAMPHETLTIGSGPRAGQTIPVETPTRIDAVLAFAGGAQVTFTASWSVAAHRHGHIELYGEAGSLFLPDPNHFGGEIVRATHAGSETLPPDDHPFGAITEDTRANHRGAGLADMAAALGDGRPHRCDAALARHVLEVLTAMLASGASGRAVGIGATCPRPEPLSADAARGLIAPAPDQPHLE